MNILIDIIIAYIAGWAITALLMYFFKMHILPAYVIGWIVSFGVYFALIKV